MSDAAPHPRRPGDAFADPYATAALIRSRRTIHLFADEPAPEEALLAAIDLARWAPNHRLTEPWRFYVLGPETAASVALRNAEIVTAQRGEAAGQAKLKRWRSMPGWFVVTARTADDAIITQENYAAACCAVQNLMLYLWSEGIGVKWGTGAVTRDARFFDLVGIDPEAEQLIGLFWYGYPAEVPRMQRKPVREVLTVLP